jgi:flagellar P-ring protein precursor FlgI
MPATVTAKHHRVPRPAVVGSRIGWKGLFSLVVALLCSQVANAQSGSDLRIKDICRLRGQEENTLQGLGVVVGLKGTGDGDSSPTTQALARTVQLMGGQINVDQQGILQDGDLKNSKNVALVFVTATLPATGVQQGDQLNCTVSAVSAKSLEGGVLLLTPLLGPRADQQTVYALAQGPIVLEDVRLPTSARIERGVKCEANIVNEYVANDRITLVLDPNHSSFTTAQYIEDTINDFHRNGLSSVGLTGQLNSSQTSQPLAIALDQVHVEVRIPDNYLQRPVQFVALVMDLPLANLRNNKRVVIQEREGVVIIGEDVTISPVAISHKNLTISTRIPASTAFVGVESSDPANERPKLKNLVDSLNKLAVPTDDIIAIIKALKRQGNLYGELVIN